MDKTKNKISQIQDVFSHSFLYELGTITSEIHKRNRNRRTKVFLKGDTGQDVVSESDLKNEQLLRQLLKTRLQDIAFIYGEEKGFETIRDGVYGALIDPIDGTRPYTTGIFYSSISVSFVDLQGGVLAGYIVRINNQWEDDLSVWTFDGMSVQKDANEFFVADNAKSLKEACISVTNVANYSKKVRTISALVFKMIADRSRGPVSICSGASEILSVIEGGLSGFINFAQMDMVSHPVAIAMAKNLGLYVRHIESANADYMLEIIPSERSIQPVSELSVVVVPQILKHDIDTIIADALSLYDRIEPVIL